jgi:hypothetical protein
MANSIHFADIIPGSRTRSRLLADMVQFFGLLLALTPAAIMLLAKPSTDNQLLLMADVLCPLIGSWMLLIRLKNKTVVVVAGIGLGAVFFLINIFVALFVGCSQHPI